MAENAIEFGFIADKKNIMKGTLTFEYSGDAFIDSVNLGKETSRRSYITKLCYKYPHLET